MERLKNWVNCLDEKIIKFLKKLKEKEIRSLEKINKERIELIMKVMWVVLISILLILIWMEYIKLWILIRSLIVLVFILIYKLMNNYIFEKDLRKDDEFSIMKTMEDWMGVSIFESRKGEDWAGFILQKPKTLKEIKLSKIAKTRMDKLMTLYYSWYVRIFRKLSSLFFLRVAEILVRLWPFYWIRGLILPFWAWNWFWFKSYMNGFKDIFFWKYFGWDSRIFFNKIGYMYYKYIDWLPREIIRKPLWRIIIYPVYVLKNWREEDLEVQFFVRVTALLYIGMMYYYGIYPFNISKNLWVLVIIIYMYFLIIWPLILYLKKSRLVVSFEIEKKKIMLRKDWTEKEKEKRIWKNSNSLSKILNYKSRFYNIYVTKINMYIILLIEEECYGLRGVHWLNKLFEMGAYRGEYLKRKYESWNLLYDNEMPIFIDFLSVYSTYSMEKQMNQVRCEKSYINDFILWRSLWCSFVERGYLEWELIRYFPLWYEKEELVKLGIKEKELEWYDYYMEEEYLKELESYLKMLVWLFLDERYIYGKDYKYLKEIEDEKLGLVVLDEEEQLTKGSLLLSIDEREEIINMKIMEIPKSFKTLRNSYKIKKVVQKYLKFSPSYGVIKYGKKNGWKEMRKRYDNIKNMENFIDDKVVRTKFKDKGKEVGFSIFVETEKAETLNLIEKELKQKRGKYIKKLIIEYEEERKKVDKYELLSYKFMKEMEKLGY